MSKWSIGNTAPLCALLTLYIIIVPPVHNHQINQIVLDEQPAAAAHSLDHLFPDSHLPSSIDSGQGLADSMLLIGTVDGTLSAFTSQSVRLARPAWTLATAPGPLVSSSLNKIEVVREGLTIELIPCLDGGLFAFNGDTIEALPMSADTLLTSSFRISDDTVITGAKETRVYGLDARTGNIKYVCAANGCNTFQPGLKKEDEERDDGGEGTLLVRRLGQTIRAFDIHQGQENWNFSVGSLDVTMAGNKHRRPPPVFHEKTAKSGLFDIDASFRFDTATGIVRLMSSNGATELLQYQFENAITAAWIVENGAVRPLDLVTSVSPYLDPALTPDHSRQMIYIGRFEDQRYIQRATSLPYPPLAQVFPSVTFRPLLISAPSRTPAIAAAYRPFVPTDGQIVEAGSKALVPVRPLEYPFDNGYFIAEENISENVCLESLVRDNLSGSLLSRLIGYWLEATGLMLLPVVLAGGWRIVRPRRDVLTLPAPPALNRQNTTSSSVRSLTSVISSLQELGPKVSRFGSDFEVLGQLGKGGFGVVYSARNRLDDNVYAVKKIQLPSSDAAREKVSREVRILAKLDHVGIVRFFNAWVESGDVDFPSASSTQTGLDHGDGVEPTSLSSCASTDLVSDWIGTSRKRQPSSVQSAVFQRPDEASESVDVLFEKDSNIPPEDSDIVQFCDEINDSCANAGQDESQEHSASGGVPGSLMRSHERHPSSASQQSSPSLSGLSDLNKSTHSGPPKPDQAKPQLFIQMELCRVETLKDWLKLNNQTRNRRHILDIFQQIVSAVEYIHSRGLMHRDLKPSNVLFSLDGSSVKIADFGLVTATADEDARLSIIPDDAFSLNGHHTNQVGTQLYMSPELHRGRSYNEKIDIYSVGLIYLELLSPFTTEMERVVCMTKAKSGVFSISGFEWVVSGDEGLLRRLLAVEPDDRPAAADLRRDLVFRDSPGVFDDNLVRSSSFGVFNLFQTN